MAVEKTSDAPGTDAPDAPSADDQKSLLKGLIKEAIGEYITENPPPVSKTNKPEPSLLGSILGFGSADV